MKYACKADFIADAEAEWSALWQAIDDLNEHQICRRHEGRSIKDAVGHLYCWHRLFLAWYQEGQSGKPNMPAKGYHWGQTRELNEALFRECRDMSWKSIRRRVKLSHGRIMKLVGALDEDQLMRPGHLGWTKKLGLISYVSANTSSHYRWAQKKIKGNVKNKKR